MSWTDEKVNKLKDLWGKGQTASQIADIIGGVSRNAVIGKAHRLNLSAKIKTRTTISNNNVINSQNNYTSKKYKTNFDLEMKANKKFEEEISRYSFNWTSGGQFSKKKIDNLN